MSGPGVVTIKNDLVVKGDLIREHEYDIAVIGSGLSAITTLKHLASITNKKIALFTNAKMSSIKDELRHNITYPENLIDSKYDNIREELINIRKNGSFGVSSSFNAGYAGLNLGKDSFKNKSDNIYYINFNNLNTPDNPSGKKTVTDLGGSYDAKMLGALVNYNGGIAATDPAHYNFAAAPQETQYDLTYELESFKRHWPNLVEKNALVLTSEELDPAIYPATDSMQKYAAYTRELKIAFENSDLELLSGDKLLLDRHNFFTGGRFPWQDELNSLQEQHSNIRIHYDTEISNVLNATQTSKILLAKNGNEFTANKVILCCGQVHSPTLFNNIIQREPFLYPDVARLPNNRINMNGIGEIPAFYTYYFMPNIKSQFLGEDIHDNVLPIYQSCSIPNDGNIMETGNAEMFPLTIFNLNNDTHFLKFIGLVNFKDFYDLDDLLATGPSGPFLFDILTVLTYLLMSGQDFEEVTEPTDRWYAWTWDNIDIVLNSMQMGGLAGF